MKRIMVDMSATWLHHGHTRLIAEAAKHGRVIIGLASDIEIVKRKGYAPELTFEQRKEILLSLREVADVVETPWLITDAVLDTHAIDLLIHGADNQNTVSAHRLLVVPRTPDTSSSELRTAALSARTHSANLRLYFTPGPGNLHPYAVQGIAPAFSRGDAHFDAAWQRVSRALLNMSGHDTIACMQGSATTALETAIRNFVAGRVLLIENGYYAKRLHEIVKGIMANYPDRIELETVGSFAEIPATKQYNWCIAVYVETASAWKTDIRALNQRCASIGCKLLLDATGSMGLEPDHHLADVIAYSACKGLFGLTGASFIAFRSELELQPQYSWIMSLETHLKQRVTMPCHAILSLDAILPTHHTLRDAVARSKSLFMAQFGKLATHDAQHQPLLCTRLNAHIQCLSENVVMYSPRDSLKGSVVSHLAAACVPEELQRSIYDQLHLVNL